MSQALYYPWIDVRDEAWLKTTLLYWDSVRTIVPESIDAPYSTDTGRALQDAGFLVPLRVHSGMNEIEELADDVVTYLGSTEGGELLLSGRWGRTRHIHRGKLPYWLRWLADIHPEKLPFEIRHLLNDRAEIRQLLNDHIGRGTEWLLVDREFATFYMTLLASRLADRVGARLLTPFAAADRLAVSARFGAKLHAVVPWSMRRRGMHWREYEAFGPRHRMPQRLAHGALANLAIDRIAVAPDTPIDRLIEFREQHRDELAQFRTKVEQLASSIEADLSAEALRQRVSEIYTGEVVPAIANLKAALTGQRIKWLGDGLLKIGFLSATSSTMLVVAGLAVPTALLVGAGISLIVTGAMYDVDRRALLRANPFAYLLSVERELA